MLRGFHSIHQALSPPWSLQKLLLLGAEQPLVTACNTVAHMVQEHAVERQLLGLLHTTLLDIFELLCVDDRRQSAGHRQQQQQQREQQSAAAPPAGADGDDSSTGCYWPDALVAAHVGLVVEVGYLASPQRLYRCYKQWCSTLISHISLSAAVLGTQLDT